jgi:hypothetical protein
VSFAAAFGLVALAGVAAAVVSALVIRSAGGHPRLARRLAGAREVRVGSLLDAGARTERPVRVTGRIRCRDPLHVPGGEPLVAYHRDVEVRLPGVGWRSLERLRETRSFELWDHDGSLSVDLSSAAEPLVTIPAVWRGDVAALDEPHASAARQLEHRHGPALEARSTTRTIHVTDRLLLLAVVASGANGGVALEPPPGGYIVSALPLPDAMRTLGGRRRTMAAGIVGLAFGVLLAVGGMVAALIAAALGG